MYFEKDDNVLYGDNEVIIGGETYRRVSDRTYDRRPVTEKDSLSYTDEELKQCDNEKPKKTWKERWDQLSDWVDEEKILIIQFIQGFAIACLAAANLLTLSIALGG